MKHVKLFENFINEGVNMKKAYKEVKKYNNNTEFNGDIISVETESGDNPWGDNHVYTFYWDGESAWCESDAPSSAEFAEPVTSAREFTSAIMNSEDWE